MNDLRDIQVTNETIYLYFRYWNISGIFGLIIGRADLKIRYDGGDGREATTRTPFDDGDDPE